MSQRSKKELRTAVPAGWLPRAGWHRSSTDGALGAGPEALAQEPFQYFARSAFWQARVRELQKAGNFVIRQALATVADQCLRGDVHARLQDHTGGHQFSPLRVGDPEDRHLTDRRMVDNDRLDLAAIAMLAAGDDHVLQPIEYVTVTVSVLVADVSGAKEAVSKGGCGILPIV